MDILSLLFSSSDIFADANHAFIGELISGAASIIGQNKANKAAKQAAEAQMAFQREMRDTAHQSEVKDLRAAGLNPLLSGTGGPGSAVPAGASYTPQNELSGGVSSALQAATVKSEIEQRKAAIDQLESTTKQADTQAELNKAAAIKTAVDTMTSESNAKAAAINAQAAQAMLPATQAKAAYESGTTAKVLRYVNGVLSPVVELFHGSSSAGKAARQYHEINK